MRNALLRNVISILGVFLVFGAMAPQAYARVFRDHIPSAAGTGAAGTAICPVPPPGFDILHASIAELHYYGLPLPPEGSAIERANWAKDFQHLKSRFCGNGTSRMVDHRLGNPHATSAGSSTSATWSGYDANNGGFTRVSGKWTVPTYTGTSTDSTAVQWVGIGGSCQQCNLFQAGTETDPLQHYRFWWEAFPSNRQQFQGPSVGPGNQV